VPEYRFWLKKFNSGVSLAKEFATENRGFFCRPVKRIFFLGMGGSSAAGNIVSSICMQLGIDHVSEIDPCNIPRTVGQNDLVIVVSCSGNTWETVEAAKTLHKQNSNVLAISRGGKLGELAKSLDFPIILMLQEKSQPREEIGSFIGILLELLGQVEFFDTKNLIDRLKAHIGQILPRLQERETYSEFFGLVGTRTHSFHVWGVSGDTKMVARRCQAQFNENSKVRAVASVFPELAHNLVVGFTDCSNNPFVLVLATDFLEKPLASVLNRLKDILSKRGATLYSPHVLGDTWEEQLVYLVVWSDFASYFLGKERGVDVDSIEIIDQLKR
jgi:glucose/mannose-6-phosphate isomerase